MANKQFQVVCGDFDQENSRLNAEYAMIFDVISKFPEILTEQELIKKLLDTFSVLFMPRKIGYYGVRRAISAPGISAENEPLLRSCIDNPDNRYVYTKGGNGFLLRLDFKGEVYGVVEIDALSFPEYRDRYLSLMLNVGKVCGLAISNARRYETINESRDQLAEVNAKLQQEIHHRQAAQEELKKLNAELEDEVRKRTMDLQDLNTFLEEEVAERQAAQELLGKLNAELESKVLQRTSELQEINDELTSFANGIAHDFRSPMVNLKGFSSELESSLAEIRQLLHDDSVRMPESVRQRLEEVLDREVPEALNFIYSSVDRLDRMVDALLGLARIGRRELVLRDVEMASLVRQVCQSYRHQIESNNIKLTVGRLPVIKADLLAVERIVSNLVDNAVKYLLPGRRGQITVTCDEEEARYVFCVEDNGRGIAREDYEKVFQVFRRAGQQDIPGDGMGLAYVRTLVRQIGGRVWCESELGKGTRLMFTVPK